MKSLALLLAASTLLVTSACDKKSPNGNAAVSEASGNASGNASGAAAIPATAPNGDWSQYVTQSAAGGFVMGNPNAPAKLVEYGSMTCPHCAAFEKEGASSLVDKYVKSGKVSWEYRNFIRDSFDLSAALVARCNGAKSFFGLTRALYTAQPEWVAKIQTIPQPQMEQVMALPPQQQFPAIGKAAGFPQFAALRGVPAAKSEACLANQREIDKLVQMTSDATAQFNIPGTPSFVLNGSLLDQTATWEALEPKLKAAIKG